MTIKEARERKGWTQTDLAYFSGIPQPTISAYESGTVRPSKACLIGLTQILGVDLSPQLTAEPIEEQSEGGD